MSGRTIDEAPPIAPIHQDERRLPQGWIIIAAVLILLLGYGAWHLFSGLGDTSQTVPPAPSLGGEASPAPATPKPVVVPMQNGVQPSSLIQGESESQTIDDQPEAIPAPATGPQTPATRISSPLPAQPQIDNTVGSPATGPAVPAQSQGRVYGEQNADPRVILRARGTSRITVRGPDGTLYINRDLEAGDIYRVPNLTGLTLAVADAGAIEVDLDGQALGRAGSAGQVLGRVSLAPQALMDRFNRQ